MKRSLRSPICPPARQRGAIAVVVALSLVGMIGFIGLALDLGKLFVAKSELQNSADACALAAARELTGANTNQLKLAKAAGQAIGERHKVLFQGEQIVVKRVQFSDVLTGSYQDAFAGAGATGLRFARCEVERTGIPNWFIQVLNLMPGIDIGDQDVRASAVATLYPSQITSCAIPVGICSNDVTLTPVGSWLEGVLGSGGGIGGGQYKWVDPTGGNGSAAALSAQLTGPGVCNLPAKGSSVGAPGVTSSLAQAWNSRFGIYQGSVKKEDVSKGIGAPDYSGYAYTEINHPSMQKAYLDFAAQRAVNKKYQGDDETGLNTKQGSVQERPFLELHGRDRRLATAAVVNCSGGAMTVESFACVFMLHPINYSQGGSGTGATRMYLEYLGPSNKPGSPCATTGVPAGPNAAGALVPALVR